MRRGADRLRSRAVHLALDDLRVDTLAAVVHGRVVDKLVDTGLRIDLDEARVDLRRIRERQVAVLPFEVGLLERRPVDVPAVERDVQVLRKAGVVRVQDRAERHERQGRLRVPLHPGHALGELDVVRGAAEHDGGELLHLPGEHVGRALDRSETRDREL